ncbi:MAG: phosphopantothenoylcysteine decarboxylase [Gemmataceae bacterium]|nr:phosphopantothenoylcysteine decarboxylase [Gemmataceae bacterium]
MANVLVGATGSVAAVRVPDLAAALAAAGHAVKVVATDAATYFFDPAEVRPLPLTPSPTKGGGTRPPTDPLPPPLPLGEGAGGRGFRDPAVVILDEDEWPGRSSGRRYERGDRVVHVELRDWADLFVLAPLDANTLAKLAVGLCDNCLTCVWRAWDPARPVVLAPAMNTRMWDHPFTRRHLRSLAADWGAGHIPGHLDAPDLIAQINARAKLLRVVAPVEKRLACGDVGVGGLAEVADIAAAGADLLAAR